MNFADQRNELVAVAFPDSEVAKNLQLGSNKASYIITHGLGEYYKRQINNTIGSSELLVAQFDESLNKVSQRGQMDLHVRYIASDDLVQTKYVTSAFLGRASAENLLEAFKSCFIDAGFLEKVLQLSMDGPAVN